MPWSVNVGSPDRRSLILSSKKLTEIFKDRQKNPQNWSQISRTLNALDRLSENPLLFRFTHQRGVFVEIADMGF